MSGPLECFGFGELEGGSMSEMDMREGLLRAMIGGKAISEVPLDSKGCGDGSGDAIDSSEGSVSGGRRSVTLFLRW